MSAPYHTDCWGMVKFIFHLFGFGTIGGVVGVSGITIIETLFILLCSGQLSSISVGLLANSYIYQLVLDNKTSRRYKALKLSQDSFLVSVLSHWRLGHGGEYSFRGPFLFRVLFFKIHLFSECSFFCLIVNLPSLCRLRCDIFVKK